MDFELSDEQRLLKESVNRLLNERYDFEDRRRYAQEPDGFSRKIWKQFAELGLDTFELVGGALAGEFDIVQRHPAGGAEAGLAVQRRTHRLEQLLLRAVGALFARAHRLVLRSGDKGGMMQRAVTASATTT